MPTDTAVELRDVSKLYGSFAALRKITAEFSAGQCYVILGPNGAGKSTLLRIIAGLIRPTFGGVAVLGSAEIADVRSQIGYLGHDSMLYDELTAVENLRYTSLLYRNAAQPSVPGLYPEQALEMVGLDARLDRPVGKFSQGMRQRAALARVLMAKPDLLLLDEPFSNVDLASSAQMLEVLAKLRADGTTILLTTHQPELARPIADCFCTMHEGQIATMQHFSAQGSDLMSRKAQPPQESHPA
ncbi:MAG: heme ABC exporter ATP-binding protein CcmA [Acidobacteriaceae bacterium]